VRYNLVKRTRIVVYARSVEYNDATGSRQVSYPLRVGPASAAVTYRCKYNIPNDRNVTRLYVRASGNGVAHGIEPLLKLCEVAGDTQAAGEKASGSDDNHKKPLIIWSTLTAQQSILKIFPCYLQ
jgi:hypothetical protein